MTSNNNAAPTPLQILGRFIRRTLIRLGAIVALLAAGYISFTYYFSYSNGDSVGYVQKLSHKGWLCKTWEGEQMRALPVQSSVMGAAEKFLFTVRDPTVVAQINSSIGTKVVLEYAQHQGLPSCFGDTAYFVTSVKAAPVQ